jgi:hypothetical protein
VRRLQEEAFQQHDVLELFTVLLDALSVSAGGYTSGTNTPASLFEFEMTDVLSYVLPDGESIRRGRRVPEKNLSLFLDETTTSLEAAVQRYVSAETIDGFQADEADGAQVTAMKALRFATLPPCLLFNLQRFNFDWERQRRVKVDQLCAFPLTIDMENFLDDECRSISGPTAYSLSAVLIHSGTAYSGHYFAYVKDCTSGTWFEFNDEKVTLLAEDGPEMDPSFFERVFGGNVSASGTGSSSMSAYGLVYRRVDAATAATTTAASGVYDSPSVPESVPPPADLAAVVGAENLRWEASRAEYIRKRDAVTFEVHSDFVSGEHAGDSVTVTLDKTSTLGAAIEACVAATEVQSVPLQLPLDQYRLRAYDTDAESPKGRALGSTRSQETNFGSTLEVLGLWKRTSQPVVLESADQDGKFPDIAPEPATVQVVMYSANASVQPAEAFSAPVQVIVLIPAQGDLDISAIADTMSARLCESQSLPKLRLAVVDASTSRPRLVDDCDAVVAALVNNAERPAGDASEPLAVYATEVSAAPMPEGTLSMQEAFELRSSMCVLRVQTVGLNGEGDDAISDHELEISRYDTVEQLRASIASMVNLTAPFIIKSLSTGEELKDGSASLDDGNLDLTDGVVASPGIPLLGNQARLQVLMKGGKTPQPIGEFIAQPDTAVSQLLQSFAHCFSTDALPSSSYACIRVRHQRTDGRLGCICSHTLSLGESLGMDTLMSHNSPSLVLEELAEPEMLEPGAVVVLLRRWDSSNSSLGEAVEVVVAPAWEMSDLLEHIEKICHGDQSPKTTPGENAPHETVPEPEPDPEARVQVIRPWAYQMKDPSSLHLANWSQPGFAKRAPPPHIKVSARPDGARDETEADGHGKEDQTTLPRVGVQAKEQQSEWNLNWGDELCWRPRPSGIVKTADGSTDTIAVPEKGITIRVHG